MSAPHIVTFYSYKGGTGRSMALANVAWILAANGKRVLVIDWDLEAPGLHRYFHPFLADKELVRSDGLIDFVMQYAEQAVAKTKRSKAWHEPYANILRYATSLDYPFAKKATIDFVPAGRQGADYATRVNAFNWQHFYEKLDGGLLLEAAKLSMADYDYVLIDSRTGVSDTSGICTVQMPETLVVCFTLNTQSIDGAAAVVESADAQRRNASGERTLRILPVPTRVELTERAKLDAGMEAARKRFDPLLWHVPGSVDDYWERISVQYQPYYAFEEVLAVFGDVPGNTQSMLASMESLAGCITNRSEPLRLPALTTAEREAVLARYLRQQRIESPYILRRVTAHAASVKSLAISPDGELVVSGDDHGIALVWQEETGALNATLASHGRAVRAVAFSSDGKNAFTAGDDGTIATWPQRLGRAGHTVHSGSPVSPVQAVAATADRKYLVCGSEDGKVLALDSSGAHLLGRHGGPVWAVAVTSDSKFAVSGSFDRILIRWDISRQQPVMTYSGHTAEVSSVAIGRGDRVILSGSYDNTLRLWDLDTGATIRTFEGHSGRVLGVALSPDAQIGASASADKTVGIWDIATGRRLLQLAGHSGSVNAVAFTPDGKRVISASDDGTLIVWNVEEAAVNAKPPDFNFDMTLAKDMKVRKPFRLRKAAKGPLVYVSYSRADRDRYLMQFVRDLEAELRRVSGESGETIVWWDDSLQRGEGWSDAIAAALGSSRVAVCMVSPSYFENVYCGKEFSIFLMRAKHGGGVFPVIWSPADNWPDAMQRIQSGAEDIGVYRDEGLGYTMRLSRHRHAYETLLRQFAQELSDMARSRPLAPLEVVPPLHDMPNAFAGRESETTQTGPDSVTFLISAESPFGKPLFAIAREIAAKLTVYAIQGDPADDAALIATTAQTNSILVLIVEQKQFEAAELSRKLAGQSHCAMLVLNPSGKFKLSPRPPRQIGYYSGNLRTEAALRDALRNAIVKIRHALIARTTAGDQVEETPYLPSSS